MKRGIAFLLVLILTLPLFIPVATADEWDDFENEFYGALLGAIIEEAASEYEQQQRSSSSRKSPSVPASTAPVTPVTPYQANVKTNGGVLNVRNNSNKGATILTKLSNGSPLIVKGYTGSWLQVEANGVTGFVPSRYVTGAVQNAAAGSQESYYAIVNPTNSFVNLRSGPSTSSSVITVYYYGYRLKVLSTVNGWCQVVDEATGQTGYMSSSFLQRDYSTPVNVGDNG